MTRDSKIDLHRRLMERLPGTSSGDESSNPHSQLRPSRGAEEPPIKPANRSPGKPTLSNPPRPDCLLIIKNQTNKEEQEFRKVTAPHSTTTTRSTVAWPNPKGSEKRSTFVWSLFLLLGLDHTHTAATTSASIVQAVAKVAVKQWWVKKKMRRGLWFCLLPLSE